MLSSPRLTFLGTGTSSGVPVIGCDCAVCRSADPRDQRLRTSGLLEFTDAIGHRRVVLIDAGPDLRQQALRRGLDRCDAILFTHSHVDHTWGLDEVRRFNAVMRCPLPIYADRATMEHLHVVYSHIFQRDRNVNDSFVATLVPTLIEPLKPFELFGVQVTPLPLLHGNLPVLGFRFDALDTTLRPAREQPTPLPLAWCTDCNGMPPETWPRLRGLDTLVLDMLRYRKHPTHYSLDESLRVAEQSGARSTWLVHMTHDVEHADLSARLPEGVHLAFDMAELPARPDGAPPTASAAQAPADSSTTRRASPHAPSHH